LAHHDIPQDGIEIRRDIHRNYMKAVNVNKLLSSRHGLSYVTSSATNCGNSLTNRDLLPKNMENGHIYPGFQA
jgi:hypothetical protein